MKAKLQKLVDYLSGKKTYIVALVMAVLAALQLMGVHTGVTLSDPLQTLLDGLGLGALRGGVAKLGK